MRARNQLVGGVNKVGERYWGRGRRWGGGTAGDGDEGLLARSRQGRRGAAPRGFD